MCLRVSRVGYEGPSLPWGEGPVWVGLTPSVQDGRTAPSARRRPWAWRRRRSTPLGRRGAPGHDGLEASATFPVNLYNQKSHVLSAAMCRAGTSVTRFQINQDRDRLS